MKTHAILLVPMLLIGGVSCEPITDTVKIPIDVTSSTTPGTIAPTGSAKARQQLERFVTYAYDGVSYDIAQGRGEYLTSLAVLAGVPADSHAAFQTEMQSRYAQIYDPSLSRKESWTLVVNHAWSAGYGMAENGHNSAWRSGS